VTRPRRQRNYARGGRMGVMASIKNFRSAGNLIIIRIPTHHSRRMSLSLRTTRVPPRREGPQQLSNMQKKKTT
jgi:hypothetical protein